MASSVELTWADSPPLWDAARRLVEEYAASLGIDLGFQDFEHEIASLPEEYGPPAGWLVRAGERDARPLRRVWRGPASFGQRVRDEAALRCARRAGHWSRTRDRRRAHRARATVGISRHVPRHAAIDGCGAGA